MFTVYNATHSFQILQRKKKENMINLLEGKKWGRWVIRKTEQKMKAENQYNKTYVQTK